MNRKQFISHYLLQMMNSVKNYSFVIPFPSWLLTSTENKTSIHQVCCFPHFHLSFLPAHCPFNIPIINIYIIAIHSHLSSASSVKIQRLKLRTWWNGCSHEFGEGFDVQKAEKVSHELELRTSTLTDLVTALQLVKQWIIGILVE